MKVLVVGGTGNVGSHVVRDLIAKGAGVRVLARSPGKPVPDDVEFAQGDLRNPPTVVHAFEGVDSVFLLNAWSQSETEEGVAGVEAAKRAGVKKIVYMSVQMPPGSDIIPHFASKIPVEDAVRASGMRWTILRPNNFYQNDLAMRAAITANGVYPQPIGEKGLYRIDIRDIAQAAVNAFYSEAHDGVVCPLNGLKAWSGPETAKVYERYLDRPVRYAGDDLDAWAVHMKAFLPHAMIEDFRIMYRFFQEHGFMATPSDFEVQRRVLGREPRTFEAFVQELAPTWKAEVTAGAR